MANYSRAKVVELARSWIGKKVADGSYKTIIDIYNSQKHLPRGLKMKEGWAWCACTWSALAVKLGYEAIMPVELSCGNLVVEAKKMGIWVENDGYIPKPGDAILYDWDDSGKADNVGWPDHIGVVETVSQSSGYFVVIEGNYGKSVKRRTVSINGRYIRGFITPKYTDNEVKTGTKKFTTLPQYAHAVLVEDVLEDQESVAHLYDMGHTPSEVRALTKWILERDTFRSHESNDLDQPYEKMVQASCKAAALDNSIFGVYTTTSDLNCRNDAGNNKKVLCVIPKGTDVEARGERTGNWYLVDCVLDGIRFRGFCHRNYLKKK